MAAPTQVELMANANRIASLETAAQVKKNQAAAASAGTVTPQPPTPLKDLVLIHPDEDPFNGNENNRNVARRIAKAGKRIFMNTAQPTHMGDPNKAAEDVAKSDKVNPPLGAEEAHEPIKVVPPAPGSPAAKKLAAEAEAASKAAATGAATGGATGVKPPEWKANA